MGKKEPEYKQIYSLVPAKKTRWQKFKSFMSYDVKVSLTPRQSKIFKEVRDFWNQEIYFDRGFHLRPRRDRLLGLPAPTEEAVYIQIDNTQYDVNKNLKNENIKITTEDSKLSEIQKEIDVIVDNDEEINQDKKTEKPYLKIDL